VWFVAGTGIPQHGAQTSGSATAGINVMRDSEFLQDGLLIKFEYYASSAGTITFVVRITQHSISQLLWYIYSVVLR